MKLVQVEELLGKDIAGVQIDIRSRKPDGTPNHSFRETPEEHIRIAKGVRIKRQNGEKWLYLEWNRNTAEVGDCGYSGWMIEGNERTKKYAPFSRHKEVHILVAV
jgi:hypothetical protein